jgi:hypothetical protein
MSLRIPGPSVRAIKWFPLSSKVQIMFAFFFRAYSRSFGTALSGDMAYPGLCDL